MFKSISIVKSQRQKSVVWWGLFCIGSLLFVAHFLIVQIMNMPLNPVKLKYYSYFSGYVNPYFTQDWAFFAPQPISNDVSVFIRGKIKERGGAKLTPWFDVSDTLIDSAKGNPLSPFGSVSLALSNAAIQFLNREADSMQVSHRSPNRAPLRRRRSPEGVVDPWDKEVMTRIGTAALLTRYTRANLDQVQVGIRIYSFPRFTKRAQPDDPSKGVLTKLKWQKAPDVVPL